MKKSKEKANSIFLIAVIVVVVLSVLLITLSMFDNVHGKWEYNKYAIKSIIVPGYPVILLFVASAILLSCGQLHWRKTKINWDRYKWPFGTTCFLFAVFFLPKLISAIFNPYGLYYDDRWEMVASSGTAFTIGSYIATLINKAFVRKEKNNNK